MSISICISLINEMVHYVERGVKIMQIWSMKLLNGPLYSQSLVNIHLKDLYMSPHTTSLVKEP